MNTQRLEESRAQRIERAKVVGDYYRDLGNNYSDYEQSRIWPTLPDGYRTYSEQAHYEGVHTSWGPIAKNEIDGIEIVENTIAFVAMMESLTGGDLGEIGL
jgi:hypothetical protein